jgi:hypothetical protein
MAICKPARGTAAIMYACGCMHADVNAPDAFCVPRFNTSLSTTCWPVLMHGCCCVPCSGRLVEQHVKGSCTDKQHGSTGGGSTGGGSTGGGSTGGGSTGGGSTGHSKGSQRKGTSSPLDQRCRDEYQQPVAKPRKSGQGQVGDVARGRLTSRLTSRRPVASSASTALVGRVGLVS